MKAKELTGQKFGLLTVLARSGSNALGNALWKCACSCGKERICVGSALMASKHSSCGCASPVKHDLTGMIFGDWTALSKEYVRGKPKWICRCTCGVEKSVFETHLLRGNSKSCTTSQTHGIGKKTPGHSSWTSMVSRCTNQSHVAYSSYGGRGIKICDRWTGSFLAFYEDMGPRPDGMTLERIDTNGNYEPGNCRWATPQEQSNNTRTNRYVIHQGERLTIAQLARKQGLNYETLYSRITRNDGRVPC